MGDGWIGKIIGWDVDRLNRGDGAVLVLQSYLQLGEFAGLVG